MSGRRNLLSWMPLHVADWLASETVAELVSECGGAGESVFLRLLCRQWRNEGAGLPADPRKLRALTVATPKEWAKAWAILAPAFPVDSDGMRRNPRLSAEWAAVTGHRAKLSENGAKGNARRWNDEGEGDAGAIADPSPRDPEPVAGRSPGDRSGLASGSHPNPNPNPNPNEEPDGLRARAVSCSDGAPVFELVRGGGDRGAGVESVGAILARVVAS